MIIGVGYDASKAGLSSVQGRVARHHERERDPATDLPERNARVLLARVEVAALVRADLRR